jgi:hypothetical protein
MFTVALFTIIKLSNQNKCPSTDDWMRKMWYLYTMRYYSAIKIKIMSFARTWMKVEVIMLSLIEKEKYNFLFSFTCRI